MATLTIADAARRCGVARRTLQRAIRAGCLTLTPDHRITLDALQQAGYVAATESQRHVPATPPRHTTATPQRHAAETDRSGAPVTPLDMTQELSQALAPLLTRLNMLIARLDTLCQTLAHLAVTVTPQGQIAAATDRGDIPAAPHATPQPSPQILGLYDPRAGAARIRDLRQQGLSYTLIALQLTREGIPTRYGKPWEHSSVRYVYETYGRHDDAP
jgi:hypothetical protein